MSGKTPLSWVDIDVQVLQERRGCSADGGMELRGLQALGSLAGARGTGLPALGAPPGTNARDPLGCYQQPATGCELCDGRCFGVLGEADWAGNEDALHFPGFSTSKHFQKLHRAPQRCTRGRAALGKEASRGKGTSFVSLIKLVLIAVHSTSFH